MENKHTWKITTIFVIMFFSAAGALLEEQAKQGATSYVAYLYALGGVIVTSIVLMTVPFVFWILNGEKLPYKKGVLICLLNNLFMFALSIVIYSVTEYSYLVGFWDLIFYYFINRWLFVKDKDKTNNKITNQARQEPPQPNNLDNHNKAIGFINNAMQQLPSKRNFDYVYGMLEFAGFMGIITFEEHKAYFERWRSIYQKNYNK